MMKVNVAAIFITLITFLGTFAVIVAMMPLGFIPEPSNLRAISVPSEFSALDLVQYAATENFSFGGLFENWGKEKFGHDMRIHSYEGGVLGHALANVHFYGFFASHYMHWINKNGIDKTQSGWGVTYLSLASMLQDWDSTAKVSTYTVTCSHFSMYAWISYNTTTCSSLEQAWDAEEAKILFAIEWDEKGTTMNVWNIIGMILTFQLPDVNPIIKVILAVPLWTYFCIFTSIILVKLLQILKLVG